MALQQRFAHAASLTYPFGLGNACLPGEPKPISVRGVSSKNLKSCSAKWSPNLPAELTPIEHFHNARKAMSPTLRRQHIIERAREFNRDMQQGPKVLFYASIELIRLPYPVRYAFLNAARVPTPYVHIVNRLFVIQVQTAQGPKTILASPSDYEHNIATPFFSRLKSMWGPAQQWMARLLGPAKTTVPEALLRLGISNDSIDYITYDHLHTQDLRRWLGNSSHPGIFPNARLLVMRQEWQSAHGLVAPQADWYCPGGLDGIPNERIIQLDGDTMVGQGLALIHTPGHTEGNHSIVANTPMGVLVTSENGVAAESYAPLHSKVCGVASFAKRTGMDVVLNGNTLEGGLDQYLSMVQEREMAGPCRRDERFFNTVPSSEAAFYWLFLGFSPTFQFGDMSFGNMVKSANDGSPK